MKKYARILVAVTFLLGLGVAANAETRAEVVVTLPFQFVVGGTDNTPRRRIHGESFVGSGIRPIDVH